MVMCCTWSDFKWQLSPVCRKIFFAHATLPKGHVESKIFNKDRENPTVLMLLDIVHQQAALIAQLNDEINRLKNHPRKQYQPSRLEKKEGTDKSKHSAIKGLAQKKKKNRRNNNS